MGFASFLEKIGSVFTHKKSGGSGLDGLRIKSSVEQIIEHGELVLSEGVPVGITLSQFDPMENEKLERLAVSLELSFEKRQFLEFILSSITSKNEGFLRNTFLDYADPSWSSDSIRQNVARWPSVINNFMAIGQQMPDETSAVKIAKFLGTTKEEGDFLSNKQGIYKKWRDKLKEGATRKLGKKK